MIFNKICNTNLFRVDTGLFILSNFVYVVSFCFGCHVCMTCILWSEDNLLELIFSFNHVCPLGLNLDCPA